MSSKRRHRDQLKLPRLAGLLNSIFKTSCFLLILGNEKSPGKRKAVLTKMEDKVGCMRRRKVQVLFFYLREVALIEFKYFPDDDIIESYQPSRCRISLRSLQMHLWAKVRPNQGHLSS